MNKGKGKGKGKYCPPGTNPPGTAPGTKKSKR